jgi:methyl-accepting chemotaxis protein
MGMAGVVICALGVVSVYTQRNVMMQDRQDKIRNQVESAVSMVTRFEQLAASGKLPETQARMLAQTALSAIRYEGQQYIFAFDSQMHYVVQGVKPRLLGTDAHAAHDGDGKDLGDLFDQTLSAGNGQGFTSYVWDKPGFSSPQPKISYLSTTPGWHWVIGTGIYLDDVNSAFYAQLRILVLEVALALALLMTLGTVVTRRILAQLGGEPHATSEVVKRIAAGQLCERIDLQAGDSQSLLAAVADMQEQLRRLVHEIVNSANHLGQMSAKVTSNAAEVASGSQQQSQSASAMSRSVEKLTSSINTIADHAEAARRLSQVSGDLSQEGSEVISRAMGEMERISQSVGQTESTIQDLAHKTQNISAIMQVIKEVADQTNLLALNAAIEAARAGPAGRGFAVVADEVRKLSERTAGATQEIAVMVQEIQQSSLASSSNMTQAVTLVKSGLALAQQGGDAVARIRASADEVVRAVNDISAALKAQGLASQDIALHVESIAQNSQANASASSTTSSAVAEIYTCADQLRELVSRFQV